MSDGLGQSPLQDSTAQVSAPPRALQMVSRIWWETLRRPRGAPATGTAGASLWGSPLQCYPCLGGRKSAGAAQPRLEGSKVWTRPGDKWVSMVETQGEPRERVRLWQRPQAWGQTQIGRKKVPWGKGEALLAPTLCHLPTSLDVNETNLVLRFGAREIIQRFISLLDTGDKSRP